MSTVQNCASGSRRPSGGPRHRMLARKLREIPRLVGLRRKPYGSACRQSCPRAGGSRLDHDGIRGRNGRRDLLDQEIEGSVFTRDLGAVLRFADDFDVGALWINEATRFRLDNYPFGGVKRSGVGREGVRHAIEELSQLRFVGMTI